MNYLMKKAVNLNGQDMMLAPLDIDFAHRTISLTGEIDEDVATVMNSSLRCLARDSDDDITIYIQSPGGSVSAGFSIYDTVKALKCDVVTVACGMAASMGAFLLAAAGTKSKRWCQPNAEFLSISRLAEQAVRPQIFVFMPNISSKRERNSTRFSLIVPDSLPRRLRLIPSATTS